MMRVLVAMSGGVDSAVAAALLREAGHEAIGVTMLLFDPPAGPGGRGCCGSDGVASARRVAGQLGIPHYVADFRAGFRQAVIDDFIEQYARGRTPNPCIRCNDELKFRALFDRAASLGAEAVATGHHARVRADSTGGWRLCRGHDPVKDQSYFLYRMTQDQLARAGMPVGELTKAEVREKARALGLVVAERDESQEVCFVENDDYAAFLRQRRPGMFRPGPVLDTAGREVGRHDGIAAFTLGQRRGLGIAFGERRYVVGIDAERDAVIVGGADSARVNVVEAGNVNWVWPAAREVDTVVTARIRSQGQDAPARFRLTGPDSIRVEFEEPQWLPAPGQAVVLWQGACVLGGGTIERAFKE
jgi:tRNA-specific 2-thiouridylase